VERRGFSLADAVAVKERLGRAEGRPLHTATADGNGRRI